MKPAKRIIMGVVGVTGNEGIGIILSQQLQDLQGKLKMTQGSSS